MKLFNFFKKKQKFKKPLYTEDSYIKANLVYNDNYFGRNLIILISYTDDFVQDIFEFCMACRDLSITVRQSSGYTEGKNEDGSTMYIRYNYILLSTFADRYISIPEILPLSNITFNEILPILYKTVDRNAIALLSAIKDEILDIKLFKYDKSLERKAIKYNDKYSYDDILYIKEHIPISFHMIDLLYICHIYTFSSNTENLSTFIKLINFEDLSPVIMSDLEKMFNIIYGKITKKYNIKELRNYLDTPLYLREDDDDEEGGYLFDDEVDEIFQHQFNIFHPVKDENIVYEDIDEVDEEEILEENK